MIRLGAWPKDEPLTINMRDIKNPAKEGGTGNFKLESIIRSNHEYFTEEPSYADCFDCPGGSVYEGTTDCSSSGCNSVAGTCSC